MGSRVNLLGSFPLPHKLSVPNLCSSDTWTIISILPRTPGPPSFVWLTSPSWVGASPSPGLEALPVFSPGAGLVFIVDSLVSFSRLNFLRGGRLSDSKVSSLSSQHHPAQVPVDVTSLLDGD